MQTLNISAGIAEEAFATKSCFFFFYTVVTSPSGLLYWYQYNGGKNQRNHTLVSLYKLAAAVAEHGRLQKLRGAQPYDTILSYSAIREV